MEENEGAFEEFEINYDKSSEDVIWDNEVNHLKNSENQEQVQDVDLKIKLQKKKKEVKKRNQINQENFFNNSENGKALIKNIIDIIRHQQYLLDNIDHLNEYNQVLLSVWKKQINLLDAFDRFELYKQLGRMKETMKKLLSIIGLKLEGLIQENNKDLIKKKEVLIEFLKQDLRTLKTEMDLKGSKLELTTKNTKIMNCIRFLSQSDIDEESIKGEQYQKVKQGKENQIYLLDEVIKFILNILEFEKNSNVWKCALCNYKVESSLKLIEHGNEKHLKFLSSILLGNKDKCFSLNCHDRRGNQERDNYDISMHLKITHSDIFQEDGIFSKLYESKSTSNAFEYHYGKDAKNWKQKFEKDLLIWLKRVDPGSQQFLIDRNMNKRCGAYLQEVKHWVENDQSLLRSEVDGAFGDFDQLCFLLKWSWNESKKQDELDWIQEKLCLGEPRRLELIEAVAGLLDTKQSLISQLHRYLYLGVFNFKLAQKELSSRITSLDKFIKELGVFYCVIYNQDCYSQQCLFEEILCSRKKVHFKSPLEMYEHYYDGHLGVFYALSSSLLQLNLSEQNQQVYEHQQQRKENYNIFQEMELNQIIHLLHDKYQADIKTRSKRFMRNCRKNFQLKSVCCECQRDLNHWGEVYWKEEKLEKRRKPQLILRHKQTVEEVIEVYKPMIREQDAEREASNKWSEITIIDKQCKLFQQEMFQQMNTEILLDDKGRKSQCKDCYKQQKGFNPLLKELKEEYFRLPQSNLNKKVTSIQNLKEKLQIKDSDPQFLQAQKRILNRMIEEKQGGWKSLKDEMDSGYFKINSFPKLVQIYGEISEKNTQNPNRRLSQPILTGYMKVLFQTPLIYIPGTSIIYEIQPQWTKLKHQFKLFGSSELQRSEFIQMLESHPIMQNHTYQMSKMTQLCIDQVDLMFKLNKHLIKQNKNCKGKLQQNENEKDQQQQQEKIGLELRKTADLLYFEGVLHRAQVQFLIQQFRIWLEVFENVKLRIKQFVEEQEFEKMNNHKMNRLFEKVLDEFETFFQKDKQNIFLELMLILGVFYLNGANKKMKIPQSSINTEIDERSSLIEILLSENSCNPMRFFVEFHILPIVIPLIEQFIHPIFIGTLLQIFQLNLKREIGYMDDSIKVYLKYVYEGLSTLTIKRCLPLFTFEQMKKKHDKYQRSEKEIHEFKPQTQLEEEEEILNVQDREWNARQQKLEVDWRWFQAALFSNLNEQERIDMQCRYVLAKRSLLRVLNFEREEPLIDCDLRWAMQVATIFYSSLTKRAQNGNDEEMRIAHEHVELLRNLKQEANNYLNKNKATIPEDFLFKAHHKKNGKEYQTSDLRILLEEVIKEDQRSSNNLNQFQSQDNYSQIHKLKIAYFIPMEKKLQDIVKCVQKLRSLPHRQSSRSFEKFHRYNFRELEMLAFPEIFATGQGFQQYLAPKIERSQIVIELQKQDRQEAQEVLRNLKQFKSSFRNLQNEEEGRFTNTFRIQVSLEDFTTQHRKGQDIPIPKKAILSLQQEDYIKSSLSSAFVYDMQKVSIIKVFQEASQNINVMERSFKLEQDLEIKIAGGDILQDSLKEEHILKNFKELLKKQYDWSNECQAFVNNLSEEAIRRRRTNNQEFSNQSNKKIGETDDQIMDYVRLQESLFLERKREELAQQFKNMDLSELDILREQSLIDLRKAKIKQSYEQQGSERQQSSYVDAQNELHSAVLTSVNPFDEVTKQIQKKLATFSDQYTSIGEDTKFRLLNKNTRIFGTRHAFIFWRYTQRMLSRIFSYYSVVNGVNFYDKQEKLLQKPDLEGKNQQQPTLQEFENLPPIKGSKLYFKKKYKEQRAISFQKGTPFLFLTYTLHEFDKKTYQVVQGLNFFNLEDDNLLKARQKKMDKKTYIKLTKAFAIYFHFISKIVTQCIMKTAAEFKKDSSIYKLYDYGIFGPCIGYTNRFEFQQRGSIHLHQLLYFERYQSGEINDKLLEYWASAFSLWNFKKEKDKEFVQEFRLKHKCSEDCIKKDDGYCRKGYPQKLSKKPYWKGDYLNRICPRVQDEEERTIFMHDRDVVKFFNSSCIIEACGNDKIIDYITKYISKVSKKSDDEGQVGGQCQINSKYDKQNQESESEGEKLQIKEHEQEAPQITLKKQANELVHKVISKKITPLQEAYCDLLDYPLFKTSFACMKIAQVALQEQFKINTKTLKQFYDADNPDQDLKTSAKSTIWLKYLSRPFELEDLTLNEYVMHFVWYGNKQRHKEKSIKQKEKNLFFVDLNGQIVKQREKEFDVIINLSQVYYLEDLSFEPNLFYLAMLQLFWVHRQESWLKETGDTFEGFKQAYYKLYNESDAEKERESNFQIKIAKLKFKDAVNQYKRLSPAQEKFLKQVEFVPQKQKKDIDQNQISKQFFTYHSLLRAKNTIIKLKGLMEQENTNLLGLGEEIKKVLNILRPDILINNFQREEIMKLEIKLVEYIQSQGNGWISISQEQKSILIEFSSLLKGSNFDRLHSLIFQCQNSIEITPIKGRNKEQNSQQHQQTRARNVIEYFAQSTNSKISQREIELFSNYNEENIEFPQHFRTSLTNSEFKSLRRPRMLMEEWLRFTPSEDLQRIYFQDMNQQQKLAVMIQLLYFYQSQVQINTIETREDEAIYEGCLIHGGGGVGKSFIIDFMLQFYNQLDIKYYILCPTQVAVQNLIKDKNDQSRIMTIHSFFNLNPSESIESSFDHFLAFLKYVKKENLYQSSTSPLYPELSFYNCMMKVEQFTEKLKGVRVIMLEEISMIAPKFLNLLDIYLQISLSCNLPFGGIQVFGFGDSFQLQPVTRTPTYYFESHVFQSNYFSTCLELTIPVRQAGDLEFYEQILQPIRIGEFQIHQNYKNSIRLLRMRHLDDNINNQTQFNLAQGLQNQVQRLQIENQITFLYFENQEVARENQVRAEQHIMAHQLKYQHQCQEQFRIFVNSPARLTFGVKSMKFDKLLMNISQDYEITQELLEWGGYQFSYAQHFKLLPLTIKNYIFQQLLPHVYERATQTQKIAQSFPQHIKLFKNAQIIFRKNLDKAQHMINGQAGTITDVQFEVDYKPEEFTQKQAQKKQEKIDSYLIKGVIKRKWQQDEYFKIDLSSNLREYVKKELEKEDLNNINTLVEDDILDSETNQFLQCGIQPRLKALRVQIQGKNHSILMDNLESYYQKVSVSIQSEKIIGIINQALEVIKKINRKVRSTDGSEGQIKRVIENFIIGNKDSLQLLGICLLQNQLDSHLLKKAEYHLKQLIDNLSDEWTPIQISQLPINLAYARTIHTSQGATFDNICVNLHLSHLSRPGLLYTAFSRVRNLQHLYLQGEFNEELFTDNLPLELKRFFKHNFIVAEEILNSTLFKNLIIRDRINLQQLMIKIKEFNPLIRKKLLEQLPRRSLKAK